MTVAQAGASKTGVSVTVTSPLVALAALALRADRVRAPPSICQPVMFHVPLVALRSALAHWYVITGS